MPYISAESKALLKHRGPQSSGELNYAITELLKAYLKDNGKRYATLNDIIGALEGAKLEFYDRVVRAYEDQKRDENGDVY
jgi:hypothetical protein